MTALAVAPGEPDLTGPVQEVAPRFLGAHIRHGSVVLRITEVEAYGGSDDPGSHAADGRTARNSPMFGPPGHLYVYLIYGLHVCANVVTGPEGAASAVLVRAGEVLSGIDEAKARRGDVAPRDLARGPGRLAQALGWDRTHNKQQADLVQWPRNSRQAVVGPRVGLRNAAERPWRFWLPHEPTVSAYRPAAPLRQRP